MATQEKVQKSLEALRKSQSKSTTELRKKEKVQHCYLITEAISNPTIRISTNFHLVLAETIEIYLQLCDDPDTDVRMTSEECLNRIVRAASDGYIGKIIFELHKEIKRNGAARSLRAALWLFSLLAHHIRPPKGKAYVSNLFPSLIKIAQRPEEAIHETLALSLPKILKVLTCFTMETEMRLLLKRFLKNVSNESAAIRRTTVTNILSICMNCRKPSLFLIFCLNHLMDLLVPINPDQPDLQILGSISCLKSLLPSLNNEKIADSNLGNVTDKLLQLFGLCIYYLTHKDHNTVNVCLETLNVLLQNCPRDVKKALLSSKGFSCNKVHLKNKSAMTNPRSPSELSIATNVTAEENIFSESELTETIHSDIEKWIDESKLAVMSGNMDAKSKGKSQSLNMLESSNSEEKTACDYKLNEANSGFVSKLRSHSIGDNMDNLTFSEDSSEKSYSLSTENILDFDDVQEIDIGDLSDENVPLIYCIRLITKLFLLKDIPGVTISDKSVRVSVKFLAISCLSSLLRLYPSGMFLYLDKNFTNSLQSSRNISSQNVSYVFAFKDHSDPQIRGAMRALMANFIKTVIVSGDKDYETFVSAHLDIKEAQVFLGDGLIRFFVQGLEDESANCIRQTLISLEIVLKYLFMSKVNVSLSTLFQVLPLLAKNPYWLVKVALCDLVAKLDYLTVYYLLNNNCFQDKILYNVLFELLSDTDQRVRTSAATSVVEIIPNLYMRDYHVNQDVATNKAAFQTRAFVELLQHNQVETDINKKQFIKNTPFPFCELSSTPCDQLEFSISKIVFKLCNIVMTSTSKFSVSGCIETLFLLSKNYPCTIYKNSWAINVGHNFDESNYTPDLLKLCISFLLDTDNIYDIQTHINLLNLSANLYAGHSSCMVKPIITKESPNELWSMFPCKVFATISEQLLEHNFKLLNVFHHVLNDIVPALPQFKTVLPTLPTGNNLSPIKRRKSDLDKKSLTLMKVEKEERNERKDVTKHNLGNFSHSSRYMKIYELLRGAFVNYKMSLETESSQKFLDLLKAVLHSLSIILEVASLNEFGRIAEDMLNFFSSTFVVNAHATVQGVQQLLKCLFGTNLTANISEISTKERSANLKEDSGDWFYFNVFQRMYSLVARSIEPLNKSLRDLDDDTTVMGYLHRKGVKRSENFSRSSDKVLENYIRIFESMVIKSLKQYTMTSDVKLQCQVLQLLSQLVQLRVNYCMLDSEQVFIGFVLKQFEFIEAGQVPFAGELIPKVFRFLVHLSHSKQHSKCIISIPKIIQLCDGLMASEQPDSTHCVPALEPIVWDVFLTRNKSNTSDIDELETTREVVLSMLLRLWENRKVIDLITLILEDSKYCTDNSEKWFEWSKRVFAVVLPALRQNKVRIDSVEMFVALKRLILTLNPQVFHPYDEIILIFFQEPPQDLICFQTSETSTCTSWLSKNLLLILIISLIPEEVLLTKINKLKSEFSPGSIFENVATKADPLNVNNNADTFNKIPAELIFIRFLFRVIAMASLWCVSVLQDEKSDFLLQQLSAFLLHCSFLFQSGSHCKVTTSAVAIFSKGTPFEEHNVIQLGDVNRNFKQMSHFRPLITIYWCYLLTLVNYTDKLFYSSLLKVEGVENNSKTSKCFSINLEITRIGTLISLCDYMVENISDSEYLMWFLSQYATFLVNLSEEPPVFEFISFIHRNPKFSNIFIKCLKENSNEKLQSSVFKVKTLQCIENCHMTQISAVLKFVIPDMLRYHQVSVARQAANLAGRKIEILLTFPMEDVINQLPKENLLEIQRSLISLNLVQKYETLVSFLNKLSTQYYDVSPIEFEQRRTVNTDYIKKVKINKKWFLSQIQARYKDKNMGKENAELLSKLEYNEIISFMLSSSFNKRCLKDCLKMISKKGDSDIVRASVACIWKDIGGIVDRITSLKEVSPDDASIEISRVFHDEELSNVIHSIALCVPAFLTLRTTFEDVSNKNMDDLMMFSVICLEYINNLIEINESELCVNNIDIFLAASREICKQPPISHLLDSDNNISCFCSCVNSLFRLASVLLKDDKPLPSIPNHLAKENSTVYKAVHKLYVLVSWFFEMKSVNKSRIPNFLFDSIKSLAISLSRLSVSYSYVLVPSKAWSNGWVPDKVFGGFRTQVSPLPIELLQDVGVLEEYIFRINFLGWVSRQQFEETWMCLLSVLCYPSDHLDPLELPDVLYSSSLAIKSITALLLETLTCSDAGNPNLSRLICVSRDLPLNDNSLSTKKLQGVQDIIQSSYEEYSSVHGVELLNVFESRNFEKTDRGYSYGQISIKYFLLTADIVKESECCAIVAETCEKRKKMLENSGLDLNSCLQFLLDYYTQLLKPQSNTHIRVLHEAIKSVALISDLFTDKSQFSWMLDNFLELSKLHAAEDELIHQYLIIGICKAVGVLTPELQVYQQTKKLLTQFLKSPYLSSRIACLFGLLYVLEGCKWSNISIGGISEEMQQVLPCAIEYIQLNLNTTNSILKKSQEHSRLVWSVAFYLLENVDEAFLEQNFISSTLSTAFETVSSKILTPLHQSILKALERLLVKKKTLINQFGKQYRKLALDKIKTDSPIAALVGTQLLLTYMYSDCAEYLVNAQTTCANIPTNPDHLVQTIEKISAVFERIKKGYVFEVDILCSVMPRVLDDFFLPSDVLTKVIGEFLSPQQPHPKFLSKVVFEVFQSAIRKDQLSLLREWVVFSLSNFTQSFSVGMATWCLTCFFISASSNRWLCSYFPYVQTRVGRYEYEDKKMLCIAGSDFYNSLSNDAGQRDRFVMTFDKVKDHTDTPFKDLLLSL